jgi:hypothetical protein
MIAVFFMVIEAKPARQREIVDDAPLILKE